MYSVSNAYKEQIKKPIRNVSEVQIVYGATNLDAEDAATVTADHASYNDEMPSIKGITDISFRYGYLEMGNWLLDGSHKTIESGTLPEQNQAYVKVIPYSETLSVSDTFTVSFGGGSFDFLGLMLYFDTINNVYPESVTVMGYLNTKVVFEQTYSIDNSIFSISDAIPTVGYLTITVNGGKVPYTRLRVQRIVLGVNFVFNNTNIESLEWKRSNDLIGTKLPENTLKFSFIDLYNQYNPNNPTGILSKIDEGQRVVLTFYYDLDDGTKETIPGGVFYLTGTPTISTTTAMTKVQFEAISRLQTLNQDYPYGAFAYQYYTDDAFKDVLTFAEVDSSEYDVTAIENNRHTLYGIPLYKQPAKELLQLLAMSSRCVLTDDREGRIVTADRATEAVDFTFDLNSILDKTPDVTKYPVLKDLHIKVDMNNWSDGTSISKRAEISIDTTTTQLFVIEYDRAGVGFLPDSIDNYVTVSEGVTISNYKFVGVYRLEVLASGTGTITVSAGDVLTIDRYDRYKTYNLEGEDCIIQNDFFSLAMGLSTSVSDRYISWLGDMLNRRNLYKFSSRGFPELDIGDIVNLETKYSENLQGYLVASTIKFNGTLSAEEEVLV